MKAKRNPEILKLEAAAKVEGEAKGTAGAILKVLEARGIAVSPAQREEILRCSDLARLSRWVVRASLAAAAQEVTALLSRYLPLELVTVRHAAARLGCLVVSMPANASRRARVSSTLIALHACCRYVRPMVS